MEKKDIYQTRGCLCLHKLCFCQFFESLHYDESEESLLKLLRPAGNLNNTETKQFHMVEM